MLIKYKHPFLTHEVITITIQDGTCCTFLLPKLNNATANKVIMSIL